MMTKEHPPFAPSPTYVILGEEDKGGFLCLKKLRLQTWTLSGKIKKQISFSVRK